MMDLDSSQMTLLFVSAVFLLLVIPMIAVFVIELRRTGSAPWSEFYNDRVVPLRRRRASVSRRAGTVDVIRPERSAHHRAA